MGAAVLTIAGLITLFAFATGSAVLGALNDLNTILIAVVTVPIALALAHPVASRTSGWLATVALGADLIGVFLAAGFSALLLAPVMSFNATWRA
jgi:hypothetical protein